MYGWEFRVLKVLNLFEKPSLRNRIFQTLVFCPTLFILSSSRAQQRRSHRVPSSTYRVIKVQSKRLWGRGFCFYESNLRSWWEPQKSRLSCLSSDINKKIPSWVVKCLGFWVWVLLKWESTVRGTAEVKESRGKLTCGIGDFPGTISINLCGLHILHSPWGTSRSCRSLFVPSPRFHGGAWFSLESVETTMVSRTREGHGSALPSAGQTSLGSWGSVTTWTMI